LLWQFKERPLLPSLITFSSFSTCVGKCQKDSMFYLTLCLFVCVRLLAKILKFTYARVTLGQFVQHDNEMFDYDAEE